jgi:hypothetical protein
MERIFVFFIQQGTEGFTMERFAKNGNWKLLMNLIVFRKQLPSTMIF